MTRISDTGATPAAGMIPGKGQNIMAAEGGAQKPGPWRRFAPLILIVAALAAFFLFGLDRYLSFEALGRNRQALMDLVAANGLASAAGFIVIYAVATAVSLPGGALLTLERAIDRAASLCTQTLKYAEESRDLNLTRFALVDMLDEVGQLLDCGAKLEIAVARDLEIEADREELFRVFANLVRNALEAGAEKVVVRLGGADPMVIEVCDNGPGLPPRAVENLFRPFAGSARAGGTGLGLAIARELMRAHGGDMELQRTGADGTVFPLRLSGGVAS